MVKRVTHPIFVDGLIIFLIAVMTTADGKFSSEESYKYVGPYILYWIKTGCAILASGLVALNGFRNRLYGSQLPPAQQTKIQL